MQWWLIQRLNFSGVDGALILGLELALVGLFSVEGWEQVWIDVQVFYLVDDLPV